MKNNTIKLLSALLLFVFFVGCKKEEEKKEERSFEVSIQSPTDGAQVSMGESLTISARVEGDFELHGYEVIIYPEGESENELFRVNKHVHGELIEVSETWEVDVTSPTNCTLKVLGAGDHSMELVESAKVNFSVVE